MIENKDSLPLVTIVIPCYNHEMYVKEAIESILNQTYLNIELIVIDDGSKDNSVKVIKELRKNYKFLFIYRENKGLSATLNEAIKISKGKYIAVCASDDKYISNKIEIQVDFMEKNPEYGMCYGKVVSFDDESNEVEIDIKNAPSGWVFEELILENKIPAVTQMLKRELYEDIGFYDESLSIEDWDMWLRVAEKYQIGYIDEYLAYYRNHSTNISKNVLKMYESQKLIIAKYTKIDNYNQVMRHWHLEWFNLLAKKYKKKSLSHINILSSFLFTDIRFLKGLLKFIIPSKFFK